MKKITGNEPAMASQTCTALGTRWIQEGLSIRQHFAGLAMQGMLANQTSGNRTIEKKPLPELLAAASVTMADALIAELNK